MSLSEYLAKNYLTPDSKANRKSKKRKRENGAQAGLVIADDSALGWATNAAGNAEDDQPFTETLRSAEFRKSTKSAWQTVGTRTPSSTDQAAADAILTAAAATLDPLSSADDERPMLDDSIVRMESGAYAGLQTADQVTAQLRHQQARERRAFFEDGDGHSGKGQETLYRDASGRIINVAMKRAEARKKAEEEIAKAAADVEAQKGDVQRMQKEQRIERLGEAKFMPVARFADDAELNEELKGKKVWNDPAAGFLGDKSSGKSVSGRPLFTGAAAPNRYAIRPGHRWDGVDRGTGFEKEWFIAKNRKENLKSLNYAWQMDE